MRSAVPDHRLKLSKKILERKHIKYCTVLGKIYTGTAAFALNMRLSPKTDRNLARVYFLHQPPFKPWRIYTLPSQIPSIEQRNRHKICYRHQSTIDSSKGPNKKQFFYFCCYKLSMYRMRQKTVLEFLNNIWGLGTIGIGLSYRPARLHSLAELVPWNRFLAP
jgi:hypothetical protein